MTYLEVGSTPWKTIMTVEFNSAKNGADLKYVFDQVIPSTIRSFGAFFAALEDMDVLAEEEG